MSRYYEWDLSCKVYVGNLGNNTTKYDLETVFVKFGPLRNIWVARSPPGFAFVEFEDSRDAADAVKSLDGMKICGNRVRVEMSSGRRRNAYNNRRGAHTPRFVGPYDKFKWKPSCIMSPIRPTMSPSKSPKQPSPIRSRSRSRSPGRSNSMSKEGRY